MKRDLFLLGHVFEVARKEWGIYVHNPVRDIKVPPSGRPRDRRLRWKHIDLHRRNAHLPDTKNGAAETVPLSTTAVDVCAPCPVACMGMSSPALPPRR